jgi:DNA-binding NarL/FixJ family response regulator
MLLRNSFQSKVSVFIINDDDDTRGTISLVIDGSIEYSVAGTFKCFDEAFSRFTKLPPDIILLYINEQGRVGVETIQSIRKSNRHVQIIVITPYDNSEMVFRTLKSGANGYISTSSTFTEILSAMDEVMRGGAPMSSKIARMVIRNFYIELNSPLSSRERQIMTLLSEGKSYSQIAEELAISKETSKTHIRNIYTKLEVNSRSQALSKAREERLV